MIDIAYQRNSILMMGSDVVHKTNNRRFGKVFALSNKNCTQRRLLHLAVAPISALFLLEMRKTSVTGNFFEKVVFVISPYTSEPDTMHRLRIRELRPQEKEEALFLSDFINFDKDIYRK